MPDLEIGTDVAPHQPMHLLVRTFLGRRVQAVFMAALLVVALVPIQAPAPVRATTTEASRIVAQAKSHLGAPFLWGATGPYRFDCSGFVYHVFLTTGLVSRIGGRRTTVGGYEQYFRSLGRVNRNNPQVGDLVVYGDHGLNGYLAHMGIYIGNGYTISALTGGVTIHPTKILTVPFVAYLHVSLTVGAGDVVDSWSGRASKSSPRARPILKFLPPPGRPAETVWPWRWRD